MAADYTLGRRDASLPCAFSGATDGLSSRVYTSLLALAESHAPGAVRAQRRRHLSSAAAPARVARRCAAERRAGLYNYAAVAGEPALLDAIAHDLAARGRAGAARAASRSRSGATSGLDLVFRSLLVAGRRGDRAGALLAADPRHRQRGRRACRSSCPFFTELRKPGFDLRAALERRAQRAHGRALRQPSTQPDRRACCAATSWTCIADFVSAARPVAGQRRGLRAPPLRRRAARARSGRGRSCASARSSRTRSPRPSAWPARASASCTDPSARCRRSPTCRRSPPTARRAPDAAGCSRTRSTAPKARPGWARRARSYAQAAARHRRSAVASRCPRAARS